MGKAVKPKVNPKIRRLKRMSIDELDRVAKQAAIKAVTKAAKVVKTSLVLKCTKRISALKREEVNNSSGIAQRNENHAGDEEDDDEDNASEDNNATTTSKNDELEALVARLHSMKSINHASIGKYLAYERYPKLFNHEISAEKFKANKQGSSSTITVDEEEISAEILQLIRSHKKFSEALGKMDSEITLLQTQREDQLRKQQNILNAQAVTKKPAKLGKAAANNAIFLDSLQDESDAEDGEGDSDKSDIDSEEAEIEKRREKWKMEKAARNKQNREANKIKREQQQQQGEDGPFAEDQRSGKKTDLSAYMPANQRAKYRERVFGEKRPRKNVNQPGQGLNRAERRKLEREQGKSQTPNSSASRDDSASESKKIIFEEEPNAKRQKFEIPSSAAPFSNSSQTRPESRDRNNHNQHEAPRKDHRDLSQFAVAGKEWKESGVHPSWAAKQLSKPQIVQGQGKKITFDE